MTVVLHKKADSLLTTNNQRPLLLVPPCGPAFGNLIKTQRFYVVMAKFLLSTLSSFFARTKLNYMRPPQGWAYRNASNSTKLEHQIHIPCEEAPPTAPTTPEMTEEGSAELMHVTMV